jgi:hypothetical protein
MDNDTKMIAKVIQAAAENGINAKKLFRVAISQAEGEVINPKEKAVDVFNTLNTLPKEEWYKYIESQQLDEKTKSKLGRMLKDKFIAEKQAAEIRTMGIDSPIFKRVLLEMDGQEE